MQKPLSYLTRYLLVVGACSAASAEEATYKVLLIDGQNNHKWQETTPIIKATLESTGRFQVEVATTPPKGGDMSSFKPKFSDYDVVVSNYNGEAWSEPTQPSFTDYVHGGGGFVSVHAANNSFPDWPAYNQLIGVGGWGGRTEKDGPYVYYDENNVRQHERPLRTS